MSGPRRAVIGSKANFWLHSVTDGFDLTHPATPESPLIYPRIPLETTTTKVAVDPAKTALVIIDMQNFFLSPSLGRPRDGNGIKACDKLLKHAIPACRKAGIRIIWLNWGLTQQDIDEMPPATLRAFGFETVPQETHFNGAHGNNTGGGEPVQKAQPTSVLGKNPRLYKGLGTEIGPVELEDGTTVEGGRLLMRDQWNAELYPPLEEIRQNGMSGKYDREDVWIHKDRMSGLWGPKTECTEYLDSMGIKTLLFAGVNTDQCVAGSLTDAVTKGYDCLLLNDGCGTTSPDHAQKCVEYNSARSWGFVLSCEDLEKAVENIETA